MIRQQLPTATLLRSSIVDSPPSANSPISVDINEGKDKASSSSTIQVSTANLVKNCVGAGVFSLSYRLNSISASGGNLLGGSVLIATMALWAAYNFYMVGETCRLTKTNSYTEAWKEAVSPKTAWIIQVIIL